MKFYFIFLCLSFNSFSTPILSANLYFNIKNEDKYEESEKCIPFHGTNLFGGNPNPNKCFTAQQVAQLTILRVFQLMIPKDFPKALLDDSLANSLITYFYQANCIILKEIKDREAQRYAELAFYDTVGGYLNYYLIPLTRYSVYAGTLSLEIAQKLIKLHKHCKEYVNTNGNGWLPPIQSKPSYKIEKVDMKCIQEEHCSQLIPSDDTSNEHMLIALPKIECEQNQFLTHIWLPFKRKKWYNLQSDSAAYIIFKYFAITIKCYLDEETPYDVFQESFRCWYRENLEIHLNDSVLYPGFGAILRVLEGINDKPARNTLTLNSNENTEFVESLPENKKALSVQKTHDNLVKREEKNWIELIVDKNTYKKGYDNKKMYIQAAIIGLGTIVGTVIIWLVAKRYFKDVFHGRKGERAGSGAEYPYSKFTKANRKNKYQCNSPVEDDYDDDEDNYFYDDDPLFNRKCLGRNSELDRLNQLDETRNQKAEGNQINSSILQSKRSNKKLLRQFPKINKTYTKEKYNLSDELATPNRSRVSEIKKPPSRMETASETSESSSSSKKMGTKIPIKIEIQKSNDRFRSIYSSETATPKNKAKLEMITEKSIKPLRNPINNPIRNNKQTKGILPKNMKLQTKITPKKSDAGDKKSIGRTTSWETDVGGIE